MSGGSKMHLNKLIQVALWIFIQAKLEIEYKLLYNINRYIDLSGGAFKMLALDFCFLPLVSVL